MFRRSFVIGALALSAWACAHAQGSQAPLKLVVPFPPGDGLETSARALADLLAKDLGTMVIVENRPGASGAIAAEAVLRAGDGRTLLVGTTALMSITPQVRTVPYRPADLDPVAKFAQISAVVAVRSDIPARTWSEFVALAKAAPDKYTYATPGDGTSIHLGMVTITHNAGIELQAVPYKGMGPALQDFLGGRIDVYSEPAVVPHVQAGTARGLGVNSATRLPDLPDVPTYEEAGIKGSGPSWLGILAPKGTPQPLREQVEAAVKRAVADPAFSTRLPTGIQAVYGTSAEFSQQIQSEQEMFGQLIAGMGLKVE